MESLYAGIPKNAFSQHHVSLSSAFKNTVEIDSIEITTSSINPSFKIKSHTLTGSAIEIVDSAGNVNAYIQGVIQGHAKAAFFHLAS